MLWMVDTVLASDHFPVAWTAAGKTNWDAVETHTKQALGRLTSTERMRFMAYGEVPKYFHALMRATTEQNPMVGVLKDASRSLSNPLNVQLPEGVNLMAHSAGNDRMRAEAYR